MNDGKDMKQFSFLYFSTKGQVEPIQQNSLLQLLLGAKVIGVSTLLLTAVDSTWVQTGVAPVNERSQLDAVNKFKPTNRSHLNRARRELGYTTKVH